MRKTAGLFIVVTACLLFAHPTFALFQFRDGWTKLMLTPHAGHGSEIPPIIADAGGTILYNYGAFILVNVPVAQQATVTSRLAPLSVSVQSSLDEQIYLGGAPIDPRVGIPANIDPAQKTFSYPAGQQGLYVVQLIGPVVAEWTAAIHALGATVEVYVHENAYLVAATPEQARGIVELPFVQFVDFLHPFEKRADFSKLETSVRYDLYVGAVATPTASNDAEIKTVAETVISRHGSGQVDYLIRVKGEDAEKLARLPLVYNFELEQTSYPYIWAAMPRHAPPGSTVIISGEGFTAGTVLTFGGVPSPRVEVLGYDRLRVQVPAITATGPVDLLVSIPTDYNQFLSGSSASGFHIDSPSSNSFKAGDLIEANTLPNPQFEGTNGGEMQWLDPQDGSLFVRRRVSDSNNVLPDANTVFIDPKGNVIYVDSQAATQYDFMSEKSTAGPAFAGGASAVLFDRAGEAIVVRGNTIERRAADGSLLRSGLLAIPSNKINSADLAADQCTLFYTNAKTIASYDVCTFQPLFPVFNAVKEQLALRILPDGTLLVADDTNTRVISRSGNVLATIPGGGTAMALSQDGSLAWIARYDGIRRYDVRSGVLSPPVLSPAGGGITMGLAVYGGWSAARGAAAYIPPARRRAAGH